MVNRRSPALALPAIKHLMSPRCSPCGSPVPSGPPRTPPPAVRGSCHFPWHVLRLPGSGASGETGAVNERATAQLRVIRAVVDALGAAGISAWLFGGWGLDARIGRITREHGDVEFWLERTDAARSKAVLVEAGATALAAQPPEEACEFTWDGTDFSTAYFDRQTDESSIQLQGRWSDWLFPPGSFGDEAGILDGAPVLAMSVAGMLAMKEQYPHLRNGGPWRQKDIDDIQVLRRLAAEVGVQP
jgi:Aminoglycoside-2''-adenylyltransferase